MSLIAARTVAGPERSPLARLDPRTRVMLALTFAATVVALQSVLVLCGAFVLALALAGLARLPPLATLRRLLALEGFMLVVLALLPLSVPGRPVAEALGLTVTAEGLVRAAIIALKANAVAVAAFALLGAMEVVTLGRALALLGAPERLVHLFLFTLRYIAVIEREYARLRLAMRARAFRLTSRPHCWRSLGYLFGMLLVRSLERAERIDAAMRARGFAGRFPRLDDEAGPGRAGPWDWGVGAAAAAALAVVVAA